MVSLLKIAVLVAGISHVGATAQASSDGPSGVNYDFSPTFIFTCATVALGLVARRLPALLDNTISLDPSAHTPRFGYGVPSYYVRHTHQGLVASIARDGEIVSLPLPGRDGVSLTPSMVEEGILWFLDPNDRLAIIDESGSYVSAFVVGRVVEPESGQGDVLAFVWNDMQRKWDLRVLPRHSIRWISIRF